MTDSLLKQFASHLVAWLIALAGLVGTIYGLRQDIRWLIVVGAFSVVGALATVAYREHAGRVAAANRADGLAAKFQELESRRTAENDNLVEQIRNIAAGSTSAEVLNELLLAVPFFGRMKKLTSTGGVGFRVRKVHREAGGLYVAATLHPAQSQYLIPEDPFILTKQGDSGVETHLAVLRLHQAPDATRNVGFFRVERPLAREHLDSLTALAEVGSSIEAVSGFTVRIIVEPEQLSDLDFDAAAQVLKAVGPLLKQLSEAK